MTYKLIDYERLNAFSEKLKTKYATKNELPKKLSDLQDDENHRVVTDTEKSTWNNKIDKSQITNDFIGESEGKILSQKGIYDLGLQLSAEIERATKTKAGKKDIPTKISQLENDKTFKTESEIQQMIEKASSLKKEVVTSLPTTGKDDVIYLVKDEKGKENNNYLEYLWLNGKYELIGSTQVDLSGYATKEDENKREQTLRNDFVGLTGYVQEQISNKLDKEEDKAIIDSNTDYFNNTLYTTPYFVQQAVGVQVSEHMSALSKGVSEELESIGEELQKTLKTTDIQEFTQQELEEAFK